MNRCLDLAMGPLLQLERVSMSFDEQELFADLNVDVFQNETVGLTGPSGSGKSTVLRIAVGLATPTSGNVYFQGKDIIQWDPRELRRKATLVPQQADMFPGTVRDNLLWGLKLHGLVSTDEQLRDILEEVNLNSDFVTKVAGNLSGGEKQRVAIARALLLEPSALLLDEPTSALDEKSTRAVETTIESVLEARKIGVLIVTHDREQAERFTDRVIEIVEEEA